MNLDRFFVLFVLLVLLLYPAAIFAQENIDPDNDGSQYAWGENVGWINLEPGGDGGPGVEVREAEVSGYVWAENIGWVSLSCKNTASCDTVRYGVTNDGSGNLSGYGWSENAGWMSLSCVNTASCESVAYSVTIDPVTGEFSGHAWAENIGWTTFRSTGLFPFGVTTSWVASMNDCRDDFDGDGDVDGLDLADFAESAFTTNDISEFALEFGRDDCMLGFERTVFVTDSRYSGNLGGLVGADQKCQNEANAAGLAGTYKAWLSDSNAWPATRFIIAPMASYVLVDGSPVADGWADLTDGAIIHPIDLTANGTLMTSGIFVWTGTRTDGTSVFSSGYCSDWTDESSPDGGLGGSLLEDDFQWTASFFHTCTSPLRLYCFQQ